MRKLELLRIKISFWFWDFIESIFSGNYKNNRRQSKNLLRIMKKMDEINKRNKA